MKAEEQRSLPGLPEDVAPSLLSPALLVTTAGPAWLLQSLAAPTCGGSARPVIATRRPGLESNETAKCANFSRRICTLGTGRAGPGNTHVCWLHKTLPAESQGLGSSLS